MRARRIVVEVASVVIAIVVALLVRTYVASVFVIPSDSMLPTLMTGDYLVVEKWPYRLSRGALPARGEVVVFRAPPSGERDYIKRVIGLPGDTIALRGGVLRLNGEVLPRWRIADFVVPVAPNSACQPEPGSAVRIERLDGELVCRTPRYREMLPSGRMIDTLDRGATEGDDLKPVTVPPGHLFLLGDDRDRSADSRFPAIEGQGIGMVPVSALIGRAGVVLFSVDGSARWRHPRSWLRAVRGARIGNAL